MQMLQYRDLRLAYRERGSGTTVLLLHGSAGSSGLWRGVGRMLEPRYRVVAPDLIGYGQSSPWPGGRTFQLEEDTAPLERLVPGHQRFHLVGYSYGGAIALSMAIANPGRLASLTLIEPGPFCILDDVGERAAFDELAQMRRNFLRRIDEGDIVAAMRDFVDYWSGAGNWDALADEARPPLLGAAPKIVLDMQASFGARFDTQAIARLGIPATLIFGERSPAPTRRLTAVLAELMRGSELVRIEGAGHVLPQTHAAQVNDRIVRRVMAQSHVAVP